MKATYSRLDGVHGIMDRPVIIPQPMQHQDGFTLLGFDSWEDFNDEKIASAATCVIDFHLQRTSVGFSND